MGSPTKACGGVLFGVLIVDSTCGVVHLLGNHLEGKIDRAKFVK